MSRHTLYAYVDGSDLIEIAGRLEERFLEFLAVNTWRFNKPHFVNQVHPPDRSMQPGDLPDWDLGLNVELPESGEEPSEWFSDIESIAIFLSGLHATFNRTFVIGIGNNVSGTSEDLFYVSTRVPDLSLLREIIGTKE